MRMNHLKLQVWHRANALSFGIHVAARAARWRDAPGLKSQLLRAVASIAANIAEAAGQTTSAQVVNFLSIAIGSTNEAETHLCLAVRLGVLRNEERSLDELDQIRRMLLAVRARYATA